MKYVGFVRKLHTSSVPSQFTVKRCVHNIHLKVWTAVRLELLSILLFFLSCALWMAERGWGNDENVQLFIWYFKDLIYSKQIYFIMYKGYLISALNFCHVLWLSFYSDLCDEYENYWYLSPLSLSLEASILGWQSPSSLFLNKKTPKFYVLKL